METNQNEHTPKNALGVTDDVAVRVGKLLMETRKELNLTMLNCGQKIRVREPYIQAMESGRWNELPAGLSGRGIVRIYARELGLDLSSFDPKLASHSSDKVPTPRLITQQGQKSYQSPTSSLRNYKAIKKPIRTQDRLSEDDDVSALGIITPDVASVLGLDAIGLGLFQGQDPKPSEEASTTPKAITLDSSHSLTNPEKTVNPDFREEAKNHKPDLTLPSAAVVAAAAADIASQQNQGTQSSDTEGPQKKVNTTVLAPEKISNKDPTPVSEITENNGFSKEQKNSNVINLESARNKKVESSETSEKEESIFSRLNTSASPQPNKFQTKSNNEEKKSKKNSVQNLPTSAKESTSDTSKTPDLSKNETSQFSAEATAAEPKNRALVWAGLLALVGGALVSYFVLGKTDSVASFENENQQTQGSSNTEPKVLSPEPIKESATDANSSTASSTSVSSTSALSTAANSSESTLNGDAANSSNKTDSTTSNTNTENKSTDSANTATQETNSEVKNTQPTGLEAKPNNTKQTESYFYTGKALLTVTNKVTIQATSDGKLLLSGSYEPGEYPIEYSNSLELLVSDGSKVKMKVGNWDHGFLGNPGRKRKLILKGTSPE